MAHTFLATGLGALFASLMMVSTAQRPVNAAEAAEAAQPAQLAKPAPATSKPDSTTTPRPLSFREAKKALRKIFASQPHQTLYAGCSFSGWKIDFTSCCYAPIEKNARRLEWEHVVPASRFGRQFEAWRKGDPRCVNRRHKRFRGRRCARKIAKSFSKMEGDMHNLFPAMGALNRARSNFGMALIDGEKRFFGRCDIEIGHHRIEPRPDARGEIARAYLYMHDRYPGFEIVTEATRPMFVAWNAADPPSDWDRRRARAIAKIQGNMNRFVQTTRSRKLHR